MIRRLGPLAIVVGLSGMAPPLRADPAGAESLFQEGRALLESGRVAEACEKFSSSQANEPSSGTLLNLADCRARQGRTATAWAHFVAAERLAVVQHRPEHEAEASRRKRELEPMLSSLTLRIAVVPAGFEARVNGRLVSQGSLGSRVPTDPGPVVVEADAPGHRPVRVEATLEPGSHHLIAIPRLVPDEPASSSRESAASPATARADSGGSNALPWIVGGTGVALTVAGGVFGALALSANAEAEELCDGRTTGCSVEATDKESERDRWALLSTIGVGAGLVGIGVGAFLLLSSDSGSQGAVSIRAGAHVSPGSAALRAELRF